MADTGSPILFIESYIASVLNILKPILILVFFGLAGATHAQKQLLVLKGEDVLLRLYPGDEFKYKLKGSQTVRTTYVNNLLDEAVVTHNDTIPFQQIDRVYFKQRKFYNTVGTFLVIFGGGLLAIDMINVHLVKTQGTPEDKTFTTMTLSSVAVGLPLMLLKKKSQKIHHRTRLLIVGKGSGFYVPDIREAIDN